MTMGTQPTVSWVWGFGLQVSVPLTGTGGAPGGLGLIFPKPTIPEPYQLY